MRGRRALVTGASGGIGWEFAQLLAAAGYDLALAARSRDRLEAGARSLQSERGVTVSTVAIDLARPGSAAELFAQVPWCDVLINNAGFANNGKFAQIDPGHVGEELQLDVVTLTELTRLYLPGMIDRRAGRILNVASTAGFLPGPNMAVYYASKAYVISFTEALAEELRGTGVTATVLCPGATKTGFQERAQVKNTPLIRFGLADARSVAKAGIDGMMRGKTVVVPGFTNKLVAISPKIAPRKLLVRISGKAVERS
jgi:short-subunit dehydrogenase